MTLEGRVAVVTGGSRGIGAAITRSLAQSGAHVAVVFQQSREQAQTLAASLANEGHSVSLHQRDVSDPRDCQRVIDDVLEERGRIDYLINNAGVTRDRTVRKMTIDDWDAVVKINLSGAFYMTKAVLEHMITRASGRIVNISSVIADMGNIGQANYAASKSGMFGFSKSLALEVARSGITVNCVAPGFVKTDMVAAIPSDALERVVARIPVQRLGRPDEVARAVRFLVDDDSSYITGTVLAVNGGLDM